jgi:hypothetical protein
MLRPYKDLGRRGPSMSRVNCSAEARPAVLARLPRAGTGEPGEMRRKKKKGETAVEPQIHPRLLYQN